MNFDSDKALKYAALFQKHEEKAFNYFFEILYSPLTYYALTITGDQFTAENIVTDSFIKIWERSSGFDNPKAIKTWLYTVVKNDCLMWLRAQKRTEQLEEQLPSFRINDFDAPVYNAIITTEAMRELDAAVAELPPRCQQVFRLHYFSGKPLPEIARELNLSFFTVKCHRDKGLASIRQRLAGLFAVLWSVLVVLNSIARL